MSSSAQHQTFPLVADVHFVARQGIGGAVILARFLDDRGGVIGQSVVDSDRLESFGRDAMSIAAACKAEDPRVVPIGRMPRTRSCLMPAPSYAARPHVQTNTPPARIVAGKADNPTGLVIWMGIAIASAIIAAVILFGPSL